MTSISAAKRLRTRVETYLAGVFHPFPEERVIAGTIQSFYGWFFPLLRNAVICGALQYFADASGSMTLQILAIIGYIALAAYCFSYINMWVARPGPISMMTVRSLLGPGPGLVTRDRGLSRR